MNKHTIRLHADHHIVSDLEIDNCHEGARDKQNTLTEQGGVEFITKARKRFFVKFTEFSFVINATERTLACA